MLRSTVRSRSVNLNLAVSSSTASSLSSRFIGCNDSCKRYISSKGSNLLASLDVNNSSVKSSFEVAPQQRKLNKPQIDLGFWKSSKFSINPNFEPFDRSYRSIINSSSTNRSVMQLWSLLEACLCSNYVDRAFHILESLYAIKPHRINFIDDYNMYLSYLADSGKIKKLSDLSLKVTRDLEKHFPDSTYNDRTIAILVHFALSFSKRSDFGSYITDINTFFSMSNNKNAKKAVLKNTDIFTLNDYKLLRDLNLVEASELPIAIRNIFDKNPSYPSEDTEKTIPPIKSAKSIPETNTNDLKNDDPTLQQLKTSPSEEAILDPDDTEISKKWDLNENIDTIEKDAGELLSVDTIGMKVIRHSLQGLSLTETQKQKIASFNFDSETSILATKLEDKSVDFYEIYCSLKTDAEREKFDEFLENFNQDRQRVLETRSTEAAKERWKHDFMDAKSRGEAPFEKKLNVKLWEWYSQMLPLIKKEVEQANELLQDSLIDKRKAGGISSDYAPYLNLVDPEKMCVITILELLKLNSTGGVFEGMRTARAVISVGKAIELEFRSEQLIRNEMHTFKNVSTKPHVFKKYVWSAKKRLRDHNIEKSKIEWPQAARAQIGSIMISTLLHVAKVNVRGHDPKTNKYVYGELPAFSHSYQYHNGAKIGVLKIHKSLIKQLNGERLATSVQPQQMPMIVKPRKWVSWNSGGYHYSQSILIRTRDSPEQVAYLKAVSEENLIPTIYSGLNVIGLTGWTVNRKVFNVLSEVWNTGKQFLDIPGIQDDMVVLPPLPSNAEPEEVREWKLKNKEIANKISSDRSVRCDSNYKLEIARAFLGEKIYFPHNLDFRGRAYPLSPHFNHLGNDMSRGLLIFWKGRRLGPQGLKWLKVHLANLFGYDKASLDDRIAFANQHIEDLKDSAEHPLDGKGWWQSADKPWQALATCMELNEAFKLENPEDFISHQPVHQDGTCNGLQHYAALGGDVEGAIQVNLVPSPKPQDVYNHVAKLVEARLDVAAKEGDETAKILQGKITRKVVKQTVMTNVYGVTFIGATRQIAKQLTEKFDDKQLAFEYGGYLAKHVFAAIRESFKGAHEIQDWLGECSKRISRAIRLDVDSKSFRNGNKPDFMSSVIWTTPLGLPIVQPYRDESKKQIKTNLQTIFIADPLAVNPVNARRQKSGFPPNFIHSLDASHMLLSATKCGEHGLDFASVHDSYWTHACDVDKMNYLLREEFIKLHEVDLIERLKTEFNQRYKDYLQVCKIPRTSPLARKIVECRKQLSTKLGRPATLADEIHEEKIRKELLNSIESEKQEAGKNMVTTVSIAEDYKDIDTLLKATACHMPILTPLTLPPIPTKGQFDVQELRKSAYFFS
ncbi:hypothetical protein TBLA_0G03490 [Henningerozyma blattae CBS 6284]|uniref:DNA-directed RNA polymerase n=1 Tax=Henningerozyma blattae (strain ATCC 34711 / CBS 6284 / DSM 70876 / NBRC 10599 / NRRL Y-10934 / UCD 77-7) TaxID=1071380 RepID=I2H7D3_HENB6|nr:hypothetical protein TBLA_0G03490 [Tetrapisispora blattae CBS 6284]CCH62285.1 hypothetical protein TBLA_0G03490 [Tetrapisispora blattae CBS 6284]